MIPIPIPSALVISAAAKLGIAFVQKLVGNELPSTIGHKLGKFFRGKPRISKWNHRENPDALIYRLPNRQSKKEKERKMKDIQAVMIRNNEVVIYRAGNIEQPLIPGVWRFEKKAVERSGAELIFISSSTFSFKWGIPQASGPVSKDGVQIGVSGEARVRITNAIKFYNELSSGKSLLYPIDVKDWIFSDIISIVRDRIQRMAAPDITSESLSMAVQAKGEKELPKYGLKVEKLNVMYTALPQDWLKARRQIGISEAEAHATRTRGRADADVIKAKMDAVKDGMRVSGETDSGVEFNNDGSVKISRGRGGQTFCPNCGYKQPSDSKFCPACGKKVK
ncbi:MAG: SPFH domain-containing protein [Candidatus Ranarchaeia archaeon]